MKREEAKEFIRRNIASLYEMEGDVQITIEELNTIDNILMEVYRRNIPSGRTCVPMEESQRKKISDARLGVPLSDATKERIRQDSQRINVYQYNLEGDELIAVWKSTREAARILGVNNSSISKCCRGKRKTAGGFIWRYKPLGEDDVRISVRIEKVIRNEQPTQIAGQYNS